MTRPPSTGLMISGEEHEQSAGCGKHKTGYYIDFKVTFFAVDVIDSLIHLLICTSKKTVNKGELNVLSIFYQSLGWYREKTSPSFG